MERTIQYTLRLLQLHCYLSDEADADEVFIKSDGEKVWPKKEKFTKMKDKSVPLNLEFKMDKGSTRVLEIWDYDFWSPNDLLGTFTIDADQSGGPYTVPMVKKDKGNAKYAIEYELM